MKKRLNQIFWIVTAVLFFAMLPGILAAVSGSSVSMMRIGILLIAPLIVLVYAYFSQRKLSWLNDVRYRTVPGKAEDYLEELLAKYEGGDHSLKTLTSLSFTYQGLGKLTDAERFARQAVTQVEVERAAYKSDMSTRLGADNAYVALANAWCRQGRFAEAARELHNYVPDAYGRNHIIAYTAWLYFLAGDETQAHDVIVSLMPISKTSQEHVISPEVHFVALYLQLVLLGKDTRKQMIKLRDQISFWNGDLHRNRTNPYGARLREVLPPIAEQLPLGWFSVLAMRTFMGEAEAMLAEALANRRRGDRSYQNNMSLSSAYSWLGDGKSAELPAREVFAAIEAEGVFNKRDKDAQFLADLAYLVVYDALVAQGKFIEAAEFVLPRASKALNSNQFRVYTLIGYMLAGESDRARGVLEQIKLGSSQPKYALSPKQQLLIAYFQHKLLGADTRNRMIQLADQIAEWDQEYQRNRANPYGERLGAILDDIRTITSYNAA